MDPLLTLPTFSLLPRALAAAHAGALTSSNADEIESVHELMRSMELQSPEKYLDQAHTAFHSGKEFASFTFVNKENEAVPAKGKNTLQVRRAGMIRKKPRFSMKPESIQPSMTLAEPDIEKLKDPVKLFEAYDRCEIAKKEERRMRGETVSDIDDFNHPRGKRQRRPEIPRKSSSYKHLHPSTLPENEGTFMSSQETLGKDLLNPTNCTLQPETVDSHAELQEKELTGSVSTQEDRFETILNELLDSNDDTDGDTTKLLRERLQIKSYNLEESRISNFPDIGKDNILDFVGKLQMPRPALSEIPNLGRNFSGKSPAKYKQMPKSPFASISALNKRIQQSTLTNDPYSALDLSPARNSSIPGGLKQSNYPDNGKELMASSSCQLLSPSPPVENSGVDVMESSKLITEGTIPQYDTSVKHQFARCELGNDDSASRYRNDIGDFNFRESVGVKNADCEVVVDVDVGQEAMLSADVNVESSSRHLIDFQTAGENQEDVDIMSQNDKQSIKTDLSKERTKSKDQMSDHRSPDAVRPSNFPDVLPEQNTQNMEEPSLVVLNDQSTAKIPPLDGPDREEVRCKQSLAEVPPNDSSKPQKLPRAGRKRNEVSRRQSLAAAGTYWDAGTRRSKRIKMRPLEYWKGERFLYGRVHESLATVIGIKYVSPAKDAERPNLRVKSYVSDEYKELVDLAALH